MGWIDPERSYPDWLAHPTDAEQREMRGMVQCNYYVRQLFKYGFEPVSDAIYQETSMDFDYPLP